MRWYYMNGVQQIGPLTEQEFQSKVREGKIRPDTPVWKDGMADWENYEQLLPAKLIQPIARQSVCSQCGRRFPEDDMIRYQGHWVCASCKPAFIQKLKETGVPTGGMIWRDKSKLVIAREGTLPDRCVKCNAPVRGKRITKQLYWHPPVYYLLVCVGLLFYVIVALFVRKRATIQIGICEKHFQKRQKALAVMWSLMAVGLITTVLGIVMDSAVAAIGLVVFVAALIHGLIKTQLVNPAKIDDRTIVLNGVCEDFLRAFPDYKMSA